MQELIPLLSGLAVGVALGSLRPGLWLPLGACSAVGLGTLATVATGEFEVSWGFLLVDIPLVALASVCGFAIARRVRHRSLGTRFP
jgi:hypothetical protein